MNPARLLLLVTFALYGARDADSFKLLKKLLAKHLERPEDGPSIADEQTAYGPTVPHEIGTYGDGGGGSAAEWTGQAGPPAVLEIRDDGTVNGARSDDASSEEELHDNGGDERHKTDDGGDEPHETDGDGTSIKDRLCDKVELIKSAIHSVKEKMKSVKEMAGGGGGGDDGADSGFLYGDGGTTTTTTTTPPATSSSVPATAGGPAPSGASTVKLADRDCAADAHGRVVVECRNEPVVVVAGPPPQWPHKAVRYHYYYYYYYPSPYGHHAADCPLPTAPAPAADKQQPIDYYYYRTNAMRYAPWTVQENGPYYAAAAAYPSYGRPGGAFGQWTTGRYGYYDSKDPQRFFPKPQAPVPYFYYNDNGDYNDNAPQHATGQQGAAAVTYAATPPPPPPSAITAKPIVAYSAEYGTPTNDGGRYLHAAAALPADHRGGTGEDGGSYDEYASSSRGDIPLQRDDSALAGGQKDVYETVLKERRHVDSSSPAPVIPASSSAETPRSVTEAAAAVPSKKTPASQP